DEGLAVKVVDFQGGSRSLQAVIGGSADVVSGAFEHTLSMQAKRQAMRAFVLQDRAPQVVMAVNKKTMKNYKTLADLKGKKLGVTAPGSSSHVIANYVLATAGLKPTDVSVIGIGSGAGAIAAVRSGQVDAFVGLDPVIATLEKDGIIQIVADTRNVAESDKLFNGPMVAGCLYAPEAFIKANPTTVQKLTNAIVRADRWLAAATPEELTKYVPEQAFLGSKEIYIQGFLHNRPAFSPDGRFPEGCAQIAAQAISNVKPELKNFKFRYDEVFTNEFVDRVPAAK
ncbi:MAG: ABC transporter substrate-binding protein, partial [Sutterella sp.]